MKLPGEIQLKEGIRDLGKVFASTDLRLPTTSMKEACDGWHSHDSVARVFQEQSLQIITPVGPGFVQCIMHLHSCTECLVSFLMSTYMKNKINFASTVQLDVKEQMEHERGTNQDDGGRLLWVQRTPPSFLYWNTWDLLTQSLLNPAKQSVREIWCQELEGLIYATQFIENVNLLEVISTSGSAHLKVTLDLLSNLLEAVHNGNRGNVMKPGEPIQADRSKVMLSGHPTKLDDALSRCMYS